MMHANSLKSIAWRLNPIMYGIKEVNKILYYITENEICKHITNGVDDVNKWLKANNKHIKNIYAKNWNKEIIVEVK